MLTEILLGKLESLDRIIAQVRAYQALAPELEQQNPYLSEDAILMNLQRACEVGISVAHAVARRYRFGVPTNAREAFQLLGKHQVVPNSVVTRLQQMIGFRNICVHAYTDLDEEVTHFVMEHGLEEIREFVRAATAWVIQNPHADDSPE
ncbi:MAG: DUF86 domain-containing protein [Fimbriimonadaceae bacterium]|nr:DUF86 domain-containing protein [Fimbriimonadaceae bacterium]